MKDIEYRHTFDNQAVLYNYIRPRYPEELFDYLVKETSITAKSKLLEIGVGTGQATRSLAELGCNIVGVEPGHNLAEVAKEELKDFANVGLITNSFEEIDLPDATFDLIYAATAFHWVDPHVKFVKSHQLLKEDGYLAVIGTNHVLTNETRDFFNATQPIYDKYTDVSTKAKKSQVTNFSEIPPDKFDKKYFDLVFFKVFPMRVIYSSEDYIKLLNTFSEVIAMDTKQREVFLSEIGNLIDSGFGGKVVKDFGMSLTVVRRI